MVSTTQRTKHQITPIELRALQVQTAIQVAPFLGLPFLFLELDQPKNETEPPPPGEARSALDVLLKTGTKYLTRGLLPRSETWMTQLWKRFCSSAFKQLASKTRLQSCTSFPQPDVKPSVPEMWLKFCKRLSKLHLNVRSFAQTWLQL